MSKTQQEIMKKLFKKPLTPEEMKQKEEERKRHEEENQRKEKERILREGEVKALFDEYDEIYGHKRYKARPAELVKYLKTKKHAVTFWQDPHIKMIYNVSDHHNFLLSIYAEETDNNRYEAWLQQYFSNPFFNHMEFNLDMCEKLDTSFDANFRSRIEELVKKQNENQRYFLLEKEYSHLTDDLKKYKIIKAISIENLLDRTGCLNGVEKSKSLPEKLANGIDALANVDQVLENADRYLTEAEQGNQVLVNLARARDNIPYVLNILLNVHHALNYGGKRKPIPRSITNFDYEVLGYDLDRTNIDDKEMKIIQHGLKKSLQNARKIWQKTETDLQKITEDFCEKIYLYHPLLMMNNNFLRIDTYSCWRKIHKEEWEGVLKKDPDMFAILDALVKSRKTYLKEISEQLHHR